ncbi:MAG: hypothetical protein AAGM36_13970, partial [Cyanobacteria bacterium J06597_1]
MPPFPITVDPNSRASGVHSVSRTALVGLASAFLLVSAGLSSGYAAAQESNDTLEQQDLMLSPAINRVFSEPESTVDEQQAPVSPGEGPSNPYLP